MQQNTKEQNTKTIKPGVQTVLFFWIITGWLALAAIQNYEADQGHQDSESQCAKDITSNFTKW